MFGRDEPRMEITREVFEAQWRPRLGRTNPERMLFAFWEWMIRGHEHAGSSLESDSATQEEEDGYGQGYTPSYTRNHFQITSCNAYAPIWTLQRMGMTRTALPDGRHIYIGGEHEDFYDPDFYIYNDVVIFRPTGEVEIYG